MKTIYQLPTKVVALTDEVELQTTGNGTSAKTTVANLRGSSMSPENYGAVGNGTTDDTAAFTAMIAAVVAAGGGTILLKAGSNYRLVPTVFSGASMFTINGVNGFVLDGSGALITIDKTYAYSGTEYHQVFFFTNSNNILLRNLKITGMAIEASTANAYATGFRTFMFGTTCKNVVADNIWQYGGNESVVSYLGTSYTEAEQIENVRWSNIVSNFTVYGPAFSSGGKNVYVQAQVSNQGRGLFIESVQNGVFVLDSVNAYWEDVIISQSRGATFGQTMCSDLDITYRAAGRTRNSEARAVYISPRTSDISLPATIRNVKFRFDIDAAGGSGVSVVALIERQYPYSTVDTGAARGHTVENIEFSGSIRNVTSTQPVFDLFQGWPQNEIVRNICFNGIAITGSANTIIRVDQTPFQGALSFKNVNLAYCGTTTDLSLNGTAWAQLTIDNVMTAARYGYHRLDKLGIRTTPDYALHLGGGQVLFNTDAGTGLTVNQNTANSLVANFVQNATTAGQAYGMQIQAGTNASDYALSVKNQANNYTILNVLGDHNVVVGSAALATTATAGFIWIPSCAGVPTGAPTAPYTSAAAMVVDTTNSKLYVRVGTTWKSCTLA
jgi:hypothetical protein